VLLLWFGCFKIVSVFVVFVSAAVAAYVDVRKRKHDVMWFGCFKIVACVCLCFRRGCCLRRREGVSANVNRCVMYAAIVVRFFRQSVLSLYLCLFVCLCLRRLLLTATQSSKPVIIGW
jgi:hypothetical protein